MASWGAQGKYFYVKSKLNGLVLDVMNSDTSPGTLIETYGQKENDYDNQLFYEDPMTGTIRTKLNDYCVEVQEDENCLVINPYEPMNNAQQWMLSGDTITNRSDPDKVWDIADNNDESGARICSWDASGGDNQAWEFMYLPPRYFQIESQMHGKVLDIKKGEVSPGAKVICYSKHDEVEDNQLWYENRHGYIAAKINNYVIDSGDDDSFTMQPFTPGNGSQEWIFSGNRIVNVRNPSKVMDIRGKKKRDGTEVIAFTYNGQDNQHWKLEYV